MKLTSIMKTSAFAFILTTSAFANTANTLTAPKSFSDFFKKERLGLFLLSSTSHQGGSTDFTGFGQTNIGYMTYKITDKESIRMENRWSINNPNGEEATHEYSRAVLKYTRSGILTQDKDGVNLSAAFEKRYYPENERRVNANAYGLNRLSASFSRKMNDSLSLGATAYVALNDVRDSADKSTTRNYAYLVLTQNFSLPYEVTFTTVQEVFKANNSQDSDEYQEIAFSMEASRSISDKLGAALGVYSRPISGSDEFTYNSSFLKDLEYSLTLTYAAF